MATNCPPTDDPIETEFRKKNRWYAFTSQMFQAMGTASFFGALGAVAAGVISLAAGLATKMPEAYTPAQYLVNGPWPYAAVGAIMALGAACTYISQHQATELKCVQDDHQAYVAMKQQVQGLVRAKPAQDVVHEQNCRADGKKWLQVVRPGRPLPEQELTSPVAQV